MRYRQAARGSGSEEIRRSMDPLTERRSFERLRDQWVEFGRSAEAWAIDPAARRIGSTGAEGFLRTGEALWRRIRERARALGLRAEGREGLDFGCGPGRLSQAMAASLGKVLGLDVSPRMVELATELDRTSGACTFALWQAPDLGGIEDGRFDLSVSAYVLQHLPFWLASRYLRELVRVTDPGGTIVLQFQGDITTPVLRHLPSGVLASAYRGLQRRDGPRARRRGPLEVHIASPRRIRRVLESAGAEVLAVDREPEPEGRAISFWAYARRGAVAALPEETTPGAPFHASSAAL
jgi:SAM-dependent methyltransferase